MRLGAVVVLAMLGAGCDPVFEYCATVVRCRDGTPVEDLRVRFDHEGVRDTRTDAEGKTCGGNVGSPGPHDVTIDLAKDGFEPLVVKKKSEKLDGWGGGRGLDVALCVCEEGEPGCRGRLLEDGELDGGLDAGRGARPADDDAGPDPEAP